MLRVIGAVGQSEREAIERQREGIAQSSVRATKAMCRLHGDRQRKLSGSGRRASGPRKLPREGIGRPSVSRVIA
jgi:hypothetical protein